MSNQLNADYDESMFMLLSDGYSVSLAFFNSVQLQLEEVLPVLAPDVSYTAKLLCGDTFWGQLDDGERRMVGRCVVDMVTRKLVPLIIAESKRTSALKYKLK